MPRERISLLFGIPVTEMEFFARVESSDFLQKYALPAFEPDSRRYYTECWQQSYLPDVATVLQRIIAKANALQIRTVTGATLSDLCASSIETEVVVLFSHWKGPDISNDDFVKPTSEAAFASRVQKDNSSLGRWLAEQFSHHRLCEPHATSRAGPLKKMLDLVFEWRRPKTLRKILQESLTVSLPNDLPLKQTVDIYLESPITGSTRRRDHIDLLFTGLIKPGNRLELFDGLHNKESIESNIAPHFSGCLDLTTCTSVAFADYIASKRNFVPRIVQFDEDEDVVWAATSLELTLAYVADGENYFKARTYAHKRLLELALHGD
jgi:hypothetical protein